ncbi:hypothetical protein ACFQ3A_39260, partial [Sphaerisporangium aureirubrum]
LAPGPQEPPPPEVPPPWRHGRGHRDRTFILAGAALALVVALVVALVASPGDPAPVRIPGAALSPALSVTPPVTLLPSPVPPGETIEPTPVPSPTEKKPKKTKKPVPGGPALTPPAPHPVLAVSPARVRVKSDYIFYVNLKLRATGGAVRWRATISEGAVLSSSSGRIRAGHTATITAYGTPYCSTSKVRFTSNGGSRTVTIIWGGVRC